MQIHYQSVTEGKFKSEPAVVDTATGTLTGTLLIPVEANGRDVVLIIAGSGPTDRDGNNPVMKNYSLRFLAEELAMNGIGSLRYDKRGVGESNAAAIPENELRFENFVKDAQGWLDLLKNDSRFKRIYILGHSEGSLTGILAAQKSPVNGLISIAGAGEPADRIIVEQLRAQPEEIRNLANPVLHSLVEGKIVDQIPPVLNSLLRRSLQPYLISWFQYNPSAEIEKLNIPILILQGNNDLQVGEKDASLLSENSRNGRLVVIERMNHVLKDAGTDRAANLATYNNPDLPVNRELVEAIVQFIKMI